VEFVQLEEGSGSGLIEAKLVWEMTDRDAPTKPVLDELRRLHVVALGQGEYLLDLTFTVTAAHGNVQFTSDAAHYAWPYVRMNKDFNVDVAKGKITNSEGGTDQAGTNAKEAHWVDYSAQRDGGPEGLAIFSHPDNGYPHLWLTRDYGTFGPRRVEAKNGKPFDLAKGQSLRQRVGILVHLGDVASGRVAERYQQYVSGSAGQ
jgi:hypothetical protein